MPLLVTDEPQPTHAPGAIIAEFCDGQDARMFAVAKGFSTHTVTAGINLPFAVRKLIKLEVPK